MASCAVLFPSARKLDADVARCLEDLSAPAMPRPGQVGKAAKQRTQGEAERVASSPSRVFSSGKHWKEVGNAFSG